MPDGQTALLVIAIAVALGFDFTNGFHDTANAIATTISTRALGARLAIALSAALNLAGAVVAIEVLHTKVANTIGGLVAPTGGVSLAMIIAALAAAIRFRIRSRGSPCRRIGGGPLDRSQEAPHPRESGARYAPPG